MSPFPHVVRRRQRQQATAFKQATPGDALFQHNGRTTPRVPGTQGNRSGRRIGQRHGGRMFNALHREPRRHVREGDTVDESLVEPVEGVNVGYQHSQHVVDVAAHAVELDDLRYRGGGSFRALLSELKPP